MKKNVAIITCSVLSLMLSQTAVFASDETAKEEETQKDETVYAMLNADGTVQNEIISSWIHNDYGIANIKEILDIQNVENIKGDEQPVIDGNTYTWNLDGNDVYYRGTSEKQLPVEVKITYILDGKTMKPEELAGKSGTLEIHISMENMVSTTKIIQGKETTIHPLYLAAGMMDLSSDHFSNVSCEHGKVLSDGNNQIVTFFTLPGFEDTLKGVGIDQLEDLPIHDTYIIKANVTDFKMGPIMIAMTPEVPLDQLKDINTLDELTAGIDALNDAGMQLLDGSAQLSDATSLFSSKMNELNTSIAPLQSGINQLHQGIEQLYQGSSELSSKLAELQKGMAQVKDGAAQLYQGTAQLPTLVSGIHQAYQGSKDLHSGLQQLKTGSDAMTQNSAQIDQLTTVLSTIAQYKDTIENMGNMISALQQLNTSFNIANGSYPSVSALASDHMNQAYTINQEMNAFCAKLTDPDLKQECDGIANEMGGSVQQTAIMNGIINGNNHDGLAQQVNGMVSQLPQDDLSGIAAQMGAIEQAVTGLETLKNGMTQLSEGVNALYAGSATLADGMKQLDDATAQFAILHDGVNSLYDGTVMLQDGSIQLYQGSLTLNQGLATAKNGTHTLVNSTPALMNGIAQLNSASSTLAEKCEQLHQGMAEFKTNGLDELSNQVSMSLEDIQLIMAIKDEIIKENENIHTFTGSPENADSKVKFMYKTAEINQTTETVNEK